MPQSGVTISPTSRGSPNREAGNGHRAHSEGGQPGPIKVNGKKQKEFVVARPVRQGQEVGEVRQGRQAALVQPKIGR